MNKSLGPVVAETTLTLRSQLPLSQSATYALLKSRLAFYCLVGFVATQGYLIPVFSLPINWAIWPSLPDLFGIAIVVTVGLFPIRIQLSEFNREMLKDLSWMGLIFAINFLLVTIPNSSTGEGIKFGGFSLILFIKYIAVYWAAAHIPLDKRRVHILHIAAVIAFLWVTITLLADRFSLIEIDTFANHLPTVSAGKWGVTGLNSTVSSTHGMTTVVVLILGALILGTARHRHAWLIEGVVFLLGSTVCFFNGSRQGIIRFLTFMWVYFIRRPLRNLILVAATTIPVVLTILWAKPDTLYENPYFLTSIERQNVLLSDPFSNEGLAGRPEIWESVVSVLDDAPIRWIVGYGMGNYSEYENSAHNMLFQYLQDGGIIELVLVSIIWLRIFRRIWRVRREGWPAVALTAGMFTSFFTSAIFYPNLATGWYLGLYFISMHIMLALPQNE